MKEEILKQNIDEITDAYGFSGKIVGMGPVGNGHINDTFKVDFVDGGEHKSYVYQRVNDYVFKNPDIIMNNIKVVSDYITEKYGENSEEAGMILSFEKAKDGNNFVKNSAGLWRVSKYIIGDSYDTVSDARVLYNTGFAFGRFQNILADLDASLLTETIPDFHNTKKRTERFFEAVALDEHGRCAECEKEIAFLDKHRNDFSRLVELHECGILPYRVTHNDTKFNNILIDKETSKPICVLDLDTVMPGLVAYDFGDAIRAGANYTVEDETDLSKVGLNFEYYEQFTKGFITSTKNFLTVSEKDSLALSAMTMTYELVVRFLHDYIDGDKYFRINHEKHNLERARCQMRLCEDMMANYGKMCGAVDKYYN